MTTLEGKTILVTGAGGSIGSEICRQVSELRPAKIVLVGHSEFPIYTLNIQLPRCIPVIADIRDLSRMWDVLFEHRPDYVFHTAAIKHLPYAQMYPMEAVKTNVVGTRNVAIASHMVGARMVLVSTDKAVEPSCVMGRTKRIAELYCGTLGNIRIVRLGNVMESSGSVIPLFKKQIAQGGPVTVTHPDMVRYFMDINQAAQLIINAALSDHENLFILKMPKRRIVDIARELIGDKDIAITYTGLRPGEKLDEKLFYPHETILGEEGDCFYSSVGHCDQVHINKTITALEGGDISALSTYD